MSRRQNYPTPGYVWAEVPIDSLNCVRVPEIEDLETIDLHEQYPLPAAAVLQETWDSHQEHVAKAKYSNLTIPYSVFNPKAEAGVILWSPGYGVTTTTPIGALSATALSALNPNHVIIVPEEARGVSEAAKQKARQGEFADYARSYQLITEGQPAPTVLAGSSRGGGYCSPYGGRGACNHT